MEKGLKEKTGKSLTEWKAIVASTGLEKYGDIMKFLKEEYNFTHGFANFVSLKYRGTDAGSMENTDLVALQYAKKQDLLPIYNKLMDAIMTMGKDITITPKKDSVSCIRKRQFALIKPATKTRVDLGLKLKDFPIGERLGNSGPFGAMCTHRVQLTSEEHVDEEVIHWIKTAYEASV